MKGNRQPLAWRAPTAAWALMLVALGASVLVGALATGPLRIGVAMGAAAVMLGGLAFGLVGLGRSPALTRLVAGAGFAFVAILFLLSFADLLTRLR